MGWFKIAQVVGKKGLRKTPLNFGKISPTITSLKGKYNIGSAGKIKKKK